MSKIKWPLPQKIALLAVEALSDLESQQHFEQLMGQTPKDYLEQVSGNAQKSSAEGSLASLPPDALVHAMFLTQGFMSRDLMEGESSTIGSEIEVMNHVAQFAAPVHAAMELADKAGYEFSGAIDYEVTEALGIWLRRKPNADLDQFLPKLNDLLTKFSDRDCEPLMLEAANAVGLDWRHVKKDEPRFAIVTNSLSDLSFWQDGQIWGGNAPQTLMTMDEALQRLSTMLEVRANDRHLMVVDLKIVQEMHKHKCAAQDNFLVAAGYDETQNEPVRQYLRQQCRVLATRAAEEAGYKDVSDAWQAICKGEPIDFKHAERVLICQNSDEWTVYQSTAFAEAHSKLEKEQMVAPLDANAHKPNRLTEVQSLALDSLHDPDAQAHFEEQMGISAQAFQALPEDGQQRHLQAHQRTLAAQGVFKDEVPRLSLLEFRGMREHVRDLSKFTGNDGDANARGFVYSGGCFISRCQGAEGPYFSLRIGNQEWMHEGLDPEPLEERLFQSWYLPECVSEADIETKLRSVYAEYPEYHDPYGSTGGDFMAMVEKFANDNFYACHHIAKRYQELCNEAFVNFDCHHMAKRYQELCNEAFDSGAQRETPPDQESASPGM